MDVLSALERFAQGDSAAVRLDPARCVHAFDAFAACRACVEQCPAGALRFDNAIALDAAACTACGACAHICPVGAFAARDESAAVLRCAARVKAQGSIALLCAAHPPIDRGIRPADAAIVTEGCLAGLGPSTYAGLLALGITQIDVYVDACAGCPLGAARASIEQTLEKARRALKPWMGADQIAAVSELAMVADTPWPIYLAAEPPLPRRKLLNPFAAAESDALLAALAVDATQQPGDKRPPVERLRLLRALALLPPADQALCPAPLAGQSFLRLGADEGCTTCGACVKACPTGALTLEIDDDTSEFRLAHRAAWCTGCEACLHLCDPDVLYSRGVPFFDALQTPADDEISAGSFARCRRCKARAPESSLDESGLCEVCAFRRENPFGSRLPDRARALLDRRGISPAPSATGGHAAASERDSRAATSQEPV